MKSRFLPWHTFNIVFLMVIVLFSTGCNRNRNNPGWDYFPDMFYSTAYESYSHNPNFKDSMTMRVPVVGTVPRGYIPFNYTIDPESRKKAGLELINPVSKNGEAIENGRKHYEIFCSGCHGPKGEGDGYLFKSGFYPLKPRSVSGEAGQKLKDGEIFHTITLGFGSMGAHGSQVRNEDRWKIVLYIRKLQEDEGNVREKSTGKESKK